MTIGSILLGLALLVVVVLYVGRPLLKAQPAASSAANGRRQLEQQKESLLAEIRELDFDHETVKIPTDFYEQQRAQLLAEAAVVLQALDEMAVGVEEQVHKQIEAAVAQRRHHQQPAPASNSQGRYCTSCGRPLDHGDKFCAGCGQPVRAVQPSI
jgi:hypothetical protein